MEFVQWEISNDSYFILENMEKDNLNIAFRNLKDISVREKSIKITVWDVDYFFYKKNNKWVYDWWGVSLI